MLNETSSSRSLSGHRPGVPSARPAPPSDIVLTRREREIVAALQEGCTNSQMAARFGVAVQTVKNQLTMVYQKAGVRSRLELVVRMMKPND